MRGGGAPLAVARRMLLRLSVALLTIRLSLLGGGSPRTDSNPLPGNAFFSDGADWTA